MKNCTYLTFDPLYALQQLPLRQGPKAESQMFKVACLLSHGHNMSKKEWRWDVPEVLAFLCYPDTLQHYYFVKCWNCVWFLTTCIILCIDKLSCTVLIEWKASSRSGVCSHISDPRMFMLNVLASSVFVPGWANPMALKGERQTTSCWGCWRTARTWEWGKKDFQILISWHKNVFNGKGKLEA